MIKLEPYFRTEYYNQECSLIQAFDLEINGDYCIGDKFPSLHFSKQENSDFKKNLNEIKENHNGKDKPVLVFQPFGQEAKLFDDGIFDYTNRSFDMRNILDIIHAYTISNSIHACNKCQSGLLVLCKCSFQNAPRDQGPGTPGLRAF